MKTKREKKKGRRGKPLSLAVFLGYNFFYEKEKGRGEG